MSDMTNMITAYGATAAAAQDESKTVTAPARLDPTKVSPLERQCVIGAFVGDSFESNFPNYMSDFESKTGKPLGIVQVFHPWGNDFGKIEDNGFDPFPLQACTYIKQNGSVPFIVWEPSKFNRDFQRDTLDYINDPELRTQYNIDKCVEDWARQAAAFKGKLFMTFAPGMNGNDYPWCGVYNGGENKVQNGDAEAFEGPQNYVKAWRWIVDKFREAGATNVTWVFSPRTVNTPGWNSIENYYPGNDYVDWIGLQGFNIEGPWASFADLFSDTLDLTSGFGKPIMISQTGTRSETASEAEPTTDEKGVAMAGKSKEQWIKQMFDMVRGDDRIKALVWNDISSKNKGDIDDYAPYFLEKMSDGRFASGFPGEQEKLRRWDPISKNDAIQAEQAELETRISEYPGHFEKWLRERHSDPDYRYNYAVDLVTKSFSTESENARIEILNKAEEQLRLIPKTVNPYWVFTTTVPVYFKAQTLLATISLALNKPDETVRIFKSVMEDPLATEGFKISARLNLCKLNQEYSYVPPERILEDIAPVIEYADRIKDPNMFSTALLTKADLLIQTGQDKEAMQILDKLFEWKDMPSQTLKEKIFGLFSWMIYPIQDQPIWVANREYALKEGSIFFEDTVFAKSPRIESLTRLAELYSLSEDPERKLHALAIFRELLTMPGAPGERIKEDIKGLISFMPEGLK